MDERALTTVDSKALMELTPERWERAKAVLMGEGEEEDGQAVVSKRAAAKAAGVTLRTLNTWIARSRENNPLDDPWVADIAATVNMMDEAQAGVLEDELWDQAVNGVRKPIISQGEVTGYVRQKDSKVALKLLEARSEKYKSKPTNQTNVVVGDVTELYRRFTASMKLEKAKNETMTFDVPTGDASTIEITEVDD